MRRAPISTASFRLVNDAGARAAALETGEADIGPNPVPLADLERLKSIKTLNVDDRIYAYAGQQNQLVINLENPIPQGVEGPTAIAHAIDIKALINVVLYGYAIPSRHRSVPDFRNFTRGYFRLRSSYQASRKAPGRSGFPAQGRRQAVQAAYYNQPVQPADLFDFFAQALAKIGIEPDIQKFDFATYVKVVYTDRAWDLSVESLSNTFDPQLASSASTGARTSRSVCHSRMPATMKIRR